jgi:uncharacterized membrane protein YoaK (UPF0700 family)
MKNGGDGQADTRLSYELAFIGGYGDAASFVLTKTFTGHVTGNLVLAAIAFTVHDWRSVLGHLSAIVTFLIGIILGVLILRSLSVWPSWRSLPSTMVIVATLISAASLSLATGMAHRVEVFVILVSLALGLQNGTFRRAGSTSMHTTYLTGMITSLITTETGRQGSDLAQPSVSTSHSKIDLLTGIGIAFVFGAGVGAAMVHHFQGAGMLGAAVLLGMLTLQEARS